MKKLIFFVDDDLFMSEFVKMYFESLYEVVCFRQAEDAWKALQTGNYPDLILLDIQLPDTSGFALLKRFKSQKHLANIPVFMLSAEEGSETRIACLKAGANDFVCKPFNPEELEIKMEKILLTAKKTLAPLAWAKAFGAKRLFDIAVSGTLLVLLSPFFLLLAILIKLDSSGPVLYISKRVGKGYEVFNFYKFRTMKANADKQRSGLQNQYGSAPVAAAHICPSCQQDGTYLFTNGKKVCSHYVKQQASAAFFKVQKDPRITWLGAFLRKTSIDELPQLFNVLKGNMSLVGNRPLPMYEAEKLTQDRDVKRFDAPAGITGLWQVTKRGKADMSEEERKALDSTYAQSHTLLSDFKILLKTIPALLQKETV